MTRATTSTGSCIEASARVFHRFFFFFFTVPIVILNNAHNNSSTPILYHPCYLHTSPFAVSDKICMQTYTEPHIGKAARD
jgi:hypothetical protein